MVELRIDMEEGETKTKIFFHSHVMMIKTSIEWIVKLEDLQTKFEQKHSQNG